MKGALSENPGALIEKPTPAPRLYRTIFVSVVAGMHVLLGLFPDLLTVFGVAKLDIWFRDTYAMLAASDSKRAGFDPFVNNPFDLIGERHIYSDWWYLLGRLGLDRSDYLWVGALVVGVFWLAVVVVLPLRTKRDLYWSLALCLSPPFWLAVNRANPDLLLFAILTPTVPLLRHRHQWVRHLALLPVALATGLKYFPLLAGVVLLSPAQTRREYLARAGAMFTLGAVLVWGLRDDVRNYLEVSWLARGQFIFGAVAIPQNLGMNTGQWLQVGRLVGIALVLISFARIPANGMKREALLTRDRLYAVMGAAVLAGNFFLTIGFLYKIIFAVWMLPLWLQWNEPGRRFAGAARWFLGSLIALVWVEGVGCVTSFYWSDWIGLDYTILVRRTVSNLAGLLAWSMMVPAVSYCGAEVRAWFKIVKETS